MPDAFQPSRLFYTTSQDADIGTTVTRIVLFILLRELERSEREEKIVVFVESRDDAGGRRRTADKKLNARNKTGHSSCLYCSVYV